jgi:hypothetical protein
MPLIPSGIIEFRARDAQDVMSHTNSRDRRFFMCVVSYDVNRGLESQDTRGSRQWLRIGFTSD